MNRRPSTRERTSTMKRFIRETPGSHSLERGLAILRAFRLGKPLLTNAEIAERTAIPRPTISRLCRSLVDAGFLGYDIARRAYRLEAVVLSLAKVYRTQASWLSSALPLMEAAARRRQINVGLAVRDQYEMIYLESVRLSRLGLFRRISSGSRVPIEPTSLGQAYLAGLGTRPRRELLRALAERRGRNWSRLNGEVREGLRHIERHGWCKAVFQSGMMAVAMPLVSPDGSVFALNVSFPWTEETPDAVVQQHAAILTDLAERVRFAWNAGQSQRM